MCPGKARRLCVALSLSGLKFDMKTAFLMIRRFPPPSARADIFAGLNSASARGTADAWIPSIVQNVVRDLIGRHVSPNVQVGPVNQRIEFLQIVVLIEFGNAEARARWRLFFSQSGEPRFFPGKCAL